MHNNDLIKKYATLASNLIVKKAQDRFAGFDEIFGQKVKELKQLMLKHSDIADPESLTDYVYGSLLSETQEDNNVIDPKTEILNVLLELNKKRPGSLQMVSNVREKLNLSKEEFDKAALDLRNSKDIVLHVHDQPGALSPEERDELVFDGKTYYVGIAVSPIKYR